MTRHHASRRAIALLLLVALPACYSYVPLESGSPRAGDDVRVHLTEASTRGSSLASGMDDEGRPFVTGLVLRTLNDSLTLAIDGADARYSGVGSPFLRDTLTLAGSEIRQIERSELDALRTAVLAGLGAGAVATAVILVINASPSGSGGIGGGGGPRASVEIPISLPLGTP